MKARVCASVAGLLMTILLASNVSAAVTLSLSTASDLSNLNVGDTISFDVVLGGLPAGSPTGDLDFLGATVSFPAALLGTPTVPVADLPVDGGVVPDLDPLAFLANATPGQADASYESIFAPSFLTITANGVFFSFDVTAQAAGSGAIGFELFGTDAFDTLGVPVAVNVSPDLTFSIASATAAIPEPTSLLMWSLFGAAVLGWSHRRNRRS